MKKWENLFQNVNMDYGKIRSKIYSVYFLSQFYICFTKQFTEKKYGEVFLSCLQNFSNIETNKIADKNENCFKLNVA